MFGLFFLSPPIFIDDLPEHRNVGDGGEEEHAGAKLDGVVAEDGINGMLVVEHRLGNFHQTVSQYGMGDVGIRLLAAVDAVESGYLGLSQSLHLWKDIPHPVSTLVAVSHFFERLGISAGVFTF